MNGATPSPRVHTDLRFTSLARSEAGPVRQLNEDRFVDLPEAGLWAVADGMGGHEAGDVAAQMVADALMEAAAAPVRPLQTDGILNALQRVNRDLLAQASRRGTSGSTVVALLAQDEKRFTCLWVGDSRAYLFRGGALLPLSRDHSFVQELVTAGLISAAEARNHPRANVITRAIGVSDDLLVETVEGTMETGDILLLCSDGLTGALTEAAIVGFLASGDLVRSADRMLSAALAAPARDNVTFVLLGVH